MAESSNPDALPAQYRLHWYALERVLGQGGFGITYLARDANLDQAVAIKEYLPVDVATRRADATVRPRSDEQNERYRWGLERFIREARTLARFDHPNIVRVHSVFEFNNTAYMVMRFEEGENLAALLERRRTLPEAELMRVLLPILDGLELVHGAGFIHRDIKPDNIHIRADGSPVLLDFGSARLALGHARTVTILVAPGYAPFEQYYSTGENQGPWTDIYGLGATCYRAISGIAPMDAIARSKGILGSTREILVPAKAIGSGRYSERLLKAIDHALEFSEKDRPQSLADWRRELTGDNVTTLAAAAPPPASAPAPAAVPAAVAPDRGPALRGPVIGAVIGAIVAAIAVGLGLQYRNEQSDVQKQLDTYKKQIETIAEEKRTQEQRLLAEQQRRDADAAQQHKLAEEKRLEDLKAREAEAKRVADAAAKAWQDATQKKTPAPRPRTDLAKVASPMAPPQTQPRAEPQSPQPKAEPAPAPEAPPAVKPEPVPLAVAKPVEKAPADDRTRALQGDPVAQLKLGEMYENGRGVPQNNFQAYYWYSAAVRGGNAAARAKKEQMAARLQPAEIQQAEKLVERLARPAK